MRRQSMRAGFHKHKDGRSGQTEMHFPDKPEYTDSNVNVLHQADASTMPEVAFTLLSVYWLPGEAHRLGVFMQLQETTKA